MDGRGINLAGALDQDFGLLEALVVAVPGGEGYQAGRRANMRLMFQAMVTRLHSPRTF